MARVAQVVVLFFGDHLFTFNRSRAREYRDHGTGLDHVRMSSAPLASLLTVHCSFNPDRRERMLGGVKLGEVFFSYNELDGIALLDRLRIPILPL